MAYVPTSDDPFSGGTKTPALSWKGLPVGSYFTLKVLEPAKLLQSRDFETNERAYWDKAQTEPIMSAVVNVTVMVGPHSVGEDRSVWAQKPSNLFAAIAEAQKQAGARIDTGGLLHIQFTGEVPHKNPKMSATKQYLAKYDPPVQQPQAPDPFSGQPGVPPADLTPLTPEQQCQYPALPQGPRPAQPNGLCGNGAVAAIGGYRVCIIHKAQLETQPAAVPQTAPVQQSFAPPAAQPERPPSWGPAPATPASGSGWKR